MFKNKLEMHSVDSSWVYGEHQNKIYAVVELKINEYFQVIKFSSEKKVEIAF